MENIQLIGMCYMTLMKKFAQTTLMVCSVALFACSTVADNSHPQQIDDKLIGIWTGEYDEEDGTTRSWTQTRKANGTYSIDFIFMEPDGAINRLTETGQWWVKDGLFHEIESPWMERPDSYQYQFKDDGCIEFLLVASEESSDDIGQYRFVECLSDDVPMAALTWLPRS